MDFDNDDYVCVGFDSAGFVKHVTTGEKWLCRSTARSIRNIYKSVRVVPYIQFLELMEKDKYRRQLEELRMEQQAYG